MNFLLLEKSDHRIHFGVMAKGEAASRMKNVEVKKKRTTANM